MVPLRYNCALLEILLPLWSSSSSWKLSLIILTFWLGGVESNWCRCQESPHEEFVCIQSGRGSEHGPTVVGNGEGTWCHFIGVVDWITTLWMPHEMHLLYDSIASFRNTDNDLNQLEPPMRSPRLACNVGNEVNILSPFRIIYSCFVVVWVLAAVDVSCGCYFHAVSWLKIEQVRDAFHGGGEGWEWLSGMVFWSRRSQTRKLWAGWNRPVKWKLYDVGGSELRRNDIEVRVAVYCSSLD